ncbi:M56 family metallopeptidase [Cellulophaga lytica]|uniref:M56 family metallopeptidase n=1 Tax=Cellulophaga lytica TaxID=979 RepID=UPI0026E22B0A|nr:M56 family metallopeptidase [Cellulophaga lytica]MDO6852222.1 M56 family metallopeptidase [Cellulophaga lytica]
MLMYLLKSTACLATLFLFYKLFLEGQNMHKFKRFYLLAALVLSFGIPLITFTTYIQVPIAIYKTPLEYGNINTTETIVEPTNYWFYLIWSIYGLGVLIFSIKFIKNSTNLFLKIKQNPKQRLENHTNVLLTEKTTPHTFLSYIFLNKKAHQQKQIPKEVLLHEITHAKQKHSIDVLLIEVLQVVFWFNPLIYFIKHAIKLNHEFLADQAVLNQGADTVSYRKILLAFSSNVTEPYMANSINYSSIKKRFTVMKKRTSKRSVVLRSLLIIPLAALLFYSFSNQKTEEIIIQQEITKLSYSKELAKKGAKFYYNNNKISSAKGLEIIKKNKNILVETHPWTNKTPEVKIFTIETSTSKTEQNTKEGTDKLKINYGDKKDPLETYKKEYNTYVTLTKQEPHYIHRSEAEKKKIDDLFMLLGSLYFSLSKEDRAKVKTANPPILPYVILIRNGKTEYKKRSELTAEDKKLLPPPPPPPPAANASLKHNSKEIKKAWTNWTKDATEYAAAVKAYSKGEKITKEELTKLYNKTMKTLDIYNAIAKKEKIESNIVPPPLPPSNNKQDSKELAKARATFKKDANAYGTAVSKYRKEGKGTREELNKLYEKTMKSYEKCSALIKKEKGAAPLPPPPPPAPPIKN